MNRLVRMIAGCCAVCLMTATVWGVPTVIVFNFQMRSGGQEWEWMEKGMADYLITEVHRSRKAAVVDREKMQEVADLVHWVPEMMTSPKQIDMLAGSLPPSHRVSGFYEVSGDELSLTLLVVKRDPARIGNRDGEPLPLAYKKTFVARTNEVTDLHRRTGAELIAWLSNGTPEKVLLEIKPWYRSITAARALYEGIDAFDGGRYADAWLLFREAARNEPDSVEIRYWIGRMLYFLGRYEHARPELARFVREYAWHPLAGAALKEYVDTFENTDTPVEDLLSLYHNLKKDGTLRAVLIPGETVEGREAQEQERYTVCPRWIAYKESVLFSQIGRNKDAASVISGFYPGDDAGCIAPTVIHKHLVRHHKLTGQIPGPESFGYAKLEACSLTRYDAEKAKWVVEVKNHFFPGDRDRYAICAPVGHVFKRLRMKPLFAGVSVGAPLEVTVVESDVLEMFGFKEGGPVPFLTVVKTVKQLEDEGLDISNYAFGGLVFLQIKYPQGEIRYPAGPLAGVKDLGLDAEFEPLPNPSSLWVECANASEFCVTVDGRYAGLGAGWVGPLGPGEHVVRFHATGMDWTNRWWETKVTTTTGAQARVTGILPARSDQKQQEAAARAVLVGHEYPRPMVSLQAHSTTLSRPAIQADNDAIRLVWEEGGDLWTAESRNGRQFANPRRLDLPVSSAWVDRSPAIARDFSGRFLLVFLSDRSRRQRTTTHFAWSRDTVRWSNPVALSTNSVRDYDMIMTRDHGIMVAQSVYDAVSRQDRQTADSLPPSRFNPYAPGRQIEVVASRDGVRWKTMCPDVFASANANAEMQGSGRGVPRGRPWGCEGLKLRQDGDGSFRLLMGVPFEGLFVSTSKDGRNWTRPMPVEAADCGFSLLELNGSLPPHYLKPLRMPGNPTADNANGMVWSYLSDPRWGDLFAWSRPRPSSLIYQTRCGPFFMAARKGGVN